MFEGKIRPCLRCGTEGRCLGIYLKDQEPPSKTLVECGCFQDQPSDHHYQAVNQWNLANTPSDDITHLKYYYARFDMTLPGLEEVSK